MATDIEIATEAARQIMQRNFLLKREAWAEYMVRTVLYPHFNTSPFDPEKFARHCIKWNIGMVAGENGNWWMCKKGKLYRPSFLNFEREIITLV